MTRQPTRYQCLDCGEVLQLGRDGGCWSYLAVGDCTGEWIELLEGSQLLPGHTPSTEPPKHSAEKKPELGKGS